MTWVAQHFVCFMGEQGARPAVPTPKFAFQLGSTCTLCCHEAVWLCSLCVAACHCTPSCWGTNRLRECPRRSCQGLCATSRRDGAHAGGSARNKCKHVCRCAADTECLHGLMAPNPCLSDCRPPLVRRPVPSTKAKRIGKVGVQALNFLGCSRF